MEFSLFEKLLAILYSILILSNALFIKKYIGTFLFPASIFCLFWFGYTFFPLVFLFNVPINSNSILFIYLCTLCFTIGSLPFNWKKAILMNRNKLNLYENFFNNNFLHSSVICLSILTMICLLIDIMYQGFLITDFIFNFFESANNFILLRYNEQIVDNIFSKLANIMNYTLVMLGGIVIYNIRKNYLMYCILILFPSIFITLTQAAKGTILLSIVLFYGGILIGRIYKDKLEITNSKTNKFVFIIFIILFMIMIVSFLSRGLYDHGIDVIIDKLIFYFSSYSFSHIYAFSDWFSFISDEKHILKFKQENEYYFGFYTFMSLYKILDIGKEIYIPLGYYDEYYYFKDLLKSNIYTLFRGTILDFGIFGSFVLSLLFGFLMSLSFFIVLGTKNSFTFVSLFIFSIGAYYTSFIISILVWRSNILSIFLLSFILYINYYINTKRIKI